MVISRLEMLSQIEPYVGQYFSKEYIKKNILRMNDEEIEDINKQIENESEDAGDEEPVDDEN